MQAGLLTDIISFLHPQTIRDALGGTSERWMEAFKKRACVRYKSGTRKEINGEVLNTHTVTIMVIDCAFLSGWMKAILYLRPS